MNDWGGIMILDENFAYLVLAIVAEIPYGKVATYGLVAKLAGYPRNSRLVARVLSDADLYGSFPCHRVVNAAGRIAPHWPEQRALLEDEGVVFNESGLLSLKDYLWQI